MENENFPESLHGRSYEGITIANANPPTRSGFHWAHPLSPLTFRITTYAVGYVSILSPKFLGTDLLISGNHIALDERHAPAKFFDALPAEPEPLSRRFKFIRPEKEDRQAYVILCIVLWSILSYILITHFVMMTVEIKGASMAPTLLDGQRYMLYRRALSLALAAPGRDRRHSRSRRSPAFHQAHRRPAQRSHRDPPQAGFTSTTSNSPSRTSRPFPWLFPATGSSSPPCSGRTIILCSVTIATAARTAVSTELCPAISSLASSRSPTSIAG